MIQIQFFMCTVVVDIDKEHVNKLDLLKQLSRTHTISNTLSLQTYSINSRRGFSKNTNISFENNKLYDSEKTVISFLNIGTIMCKYRDINNDLLFSVFFYNNGKMKISCGLSKIKVDHELYISHIVDLFTFHFTGFHYKTFNIALLNAQFKLRFTRPIFLEIWDSFKALQLRDDIEVHNPPKEGRGRINALKIKNLLGLKGTLIIDPNGTVQLMGFNSVKHVNSVVSYFYDIYHSSV